VNTATAANQHQEVHRLLRAGDLRGATLACKALTEAYPGYAPGWATASHLAFRLGNLPKALEFIDRALEAAPEAARFMVLRARTLLALGDPGEARANAATACRSAGDDARAHHELGKFYADTRMFPEAAACLERAVELAPGDPSCRFDLAATLRILGQLERAEAEYDRTIALNPLDYEARLNRADLRTQSPGRNHVADLEALLTRGIAHPRDEVFTRYALAKELEDLGRYTDSFEQLGKGAQLRRRHIDYDVERDVATADWITAAYPAGLLHKPAGNSAGAAAIFIVGMPRSGTTLLERVLDSHTQVTSAGELPDFAEALVAATNATGGVKLPRPELIAASARADFAAVGADYLRRTCMYQEQAPHFIDKLPLNYLYCGPIHLALPRARIIHLTRHPLAACYAVYKTLFRDAYPFSYDLPELARYYAAYRRLMHHWHEAMPGVILDVRYEALVADLEGETRRVLGFCGLDFEPACLEFHRNASPSTTASAAQVRRPLYSSSVDQWRDYERQLMPLRAALIDAGIPAAELQ